MAKKAKKNDEQPDATSNGNGVQSLIKELWQAAVNLRGSIEPADYKRYVLPIIFLRFLSLRFEKRREQLEKLIADPKSEYHGDKKALNDPDEYRSVGAFLVPEEARWDSIVKQAQADDIKVKLDDILELLEKKYRAKLEGLLPRILSKSRGGGGGLRKRKGEILFIDGRKLGSLIPGSRKQKQLSDEEIERMAAVYRQFKRKGVPDEVPGFCKVATIDEVREHKYALTPGRYVGSAEDDGDDEPFEEKLPRLSALIQSQMKEGVKLDKAIDHILQEVANG